jgi:hypothetical protein
MPDETADIRLVMQYMQDLVEWSSPPPPVRDEGSNVAASAYETGSEHRRWPDSSVGSTLPSPLLSPSSRRTLHHKNHGFCAVA